MLRVRLDSQQKQKNSRKRVGGHEQTRRCACQDASAEGHNLESENNGAETKAIRKYGDAFWTFRCREALVASHRLACEVSSSTKGESAATVALMREAPVASLSLTGPLSESRTRRAATEEQTSASRASSACCRNATTTRDSADSSSQPALRSGRAVALAKRRSN